MSESQKVHTVDPFVAPLPAEATVYPRGTYDPFPNFRIHRGEIEKGYATLARQVREAMPRGLRVLVVDGYHGVSWDVVQAGLAEALAAEGVRPSWVDMREYIRPEEEIRADIRPFLGGSDPLFGTRYPFGPEAFFDPVKLAALRIRIALARGEQSGKLLIVIGCGAGLQGLWDQLWYVDIPKDVLQAGARLRKIAPLGMRDPLPFGEFYKHSYFVDWPALNQLKSRLLPEVPFHRCPEPGRPHVDQRGRFSEGAPRYR